ncbi:MAG: RNA polymerase sigma factor [Saprospiraceae bacterium]|nr:RNA polymerase sigma factor [Saprospiraceae bacterium]MDW8230533.1 RNA polymerase sigma factor [Saprospiraceae bacterium]
MPATRPHASDEHIVSLLRSEETFEEGFRLLLRTYGERLYGHIRRLVLTHQDADDVLQNTFIKVYRGISGFEGKAQLYTWLYRIATNEALSFLENRRRQQTISIEDGESPIVQRLRSDPYFDAEGLQRQLYEAVARLPDKQRAVFNLRYFEEMPYEEMSRLFDTSVGALKASFHHAVKKVENYLRDHNLH